MNDQLVFTYDQARTMWCPASFSTLGQSSKCLAEDCMAWREGSPKIGPEKIPCPDCVGDEEHEMYCERCDSSGKIPKTIPRGWCGLAARPE